MCHSDDDHKVESTPRVKGQRYRSFIEVWQDSPVVIPRSDAAHSDTTSVCRDLHASVRREVSQAVVSSAWCSGLSSSSESPELGGTLLPGSTVQLGEDWSKFFPVEGGLRPGQVGVVSKLDTEKGLCEITCSEGRWWYSIEAVVLCRQPCSPIRSNETADSEHGKDSFMAACKQSCQVAALGYARWNHTMTGLHSSPNLNTLPSQAKRTTRVLEGAPLKRSASFSHPLPASPVGVC